jgi:hypothetical protein
MSPQRISATDRSPMDSSDTTQHGMLALRSGWLIKRNEQHHFFLSGTKLGYSSSAQVCIRHDDRQCCC